MPTNITVRFMTLFFQTKAKLVLPTNLLNQKTPSMSIS